MATTEMTTIQTQKTLSPKAPSVVIVGSGPAGLTAAIYAQRAGYSVQVVAGAFPHLPGGQLTTTTTIENFPGFPEGIDGRELVNAMTEQAQKLGATFVEDSVESLDASSRPFRLTLEDSGETLEADALIWATGATAKHLGVPGEQAYQSRGVAYCATCDGFLYRNKRVAVVGGGDSALEEANYLATLASSVLLIHRRQTFRASVALIQRTLNNPKIACRMNAVIQEVKGDKKRLNAIAVKDLTTQEVQDIPLEGLFVAVGRQPETDVLAGQLALDPSSGCIQVTPGTSLTSVPGIFAAGDVCDPVYRQAVVAAASGCRAAMDMDRFLKG